MEAALTQLRADHQAMLAQINHQHNAKLEETEQKYQQEQE
jgi:hypothetical protein